MKDVINQVKISNSCVMIDIWMYRLVWKYLSRCESQKKYAKNSCFTMKLYLFKIIMCSFAQIFNQSFIYLTAVDFEYSNHFGFFLKYLPKKKYKKKNKIK